MGFASSFSDWEHTHGVNETAASNFETLGSLLNSANSNSSSMSNANGNGGSFQQQTTNSNSNDSANCNCQLIVNGKPVANGSYNSNTLPSSSSVSSSSNQTQQTSQSSQPSQMSSSRRYNSGDNAAKKNCGDFLCAGELFIASSDNGKQGQFESTMMRDNQKYNSSQRGDYLF